MGISDFINRIKLSPIWAKKVETPPEPKTPIEPKHIEVPVDPLDWRFSERTPKRKVLKNPWNSQRDNKFSPSSACNVTSLQIALSLDSKVTDDELFLLCNSSQTRRDFFQKYPGEHWIKPFFDKGNANQVFLVLQEVARKVIGSNHCKMIGNLTKSKILEEIDNGYSAVVCGKFINGKHTLEHFVTIVGYDLDTKNYIVNDPWGDWNKRYTVKIGDKVEYSMDKLKIGSFLSNIAILVHADKRVPV
jgi:uncharacterized protein YvpB